MKVEVPRRLFKRAPSASGPRFAASRRWIESGSPIAFLYALVIGAYLLLSLRLPVSILTGAAHDDALFMRLGISIARGNWLGAFDQMTLAKGPAYPLFLALNAMLGSPVTLANALLWLASCWIFVRTLRAFGLGRLLSLLLFAGLLLEPALFPVRILRDNIYPSLVLLVAAGVLWIASDETDRPAPWKAAAFGVAFGALWLTREEGVWIVPGLLLFLGYRLRSLRKSGADTRLFLRQLVALVGGAIVTVFAVGFANLHAYGVFQAVDFKGSAFSTAVTRLNNVSAGPEVPYVPVPKSKRELIYKVSPAFRELETYFEQTGKRWTQFGCEINPSTCGDYAGGWFVWALRDAVATKGYYESAAEAQRYYERLSTEIETACNNGELECAYNLVPFLPRMADGTLGRIPGAIGAAVKLTLYRYAIQSTAGQSEEPLPRLNRFRLFLGSPRSLPARPEQALTLTGWYHSPQEHWIALRCGRATSASVTAIARTDSPDLVGAFNDSKATDQRFSFTVPMSEPCEIVALGQDAPPVRLERVVNGRDRYMPFGDGVLNFDSVVSPITDAVGADWDPTAAALRAKDRLRELYKVVSMPLAMVGLIAFVAVPITARRRERQLPLLFWVAAMLWTLYASRVLLIVLVHVSSFEAINMTYLGPAFPLLMAAALTSLALLRRREAQA